MSTRVSPLGRAFGTFALTVFCTRVASGPGAGPAEGNLSVAAEHYYPEVRLRKLHLVRPDLIPYPLTFDVYC